MYCKLIVTKTKFDLKEKFQIEDFRNILYNKFVLENCFSLNFKSYPNSQQVGGVIIKFDE